jgi:CRP/FNR family transcriptional regulator, cyclic AMP receptor protein
LLAEALALSPRARLARTLLRLSEDGAVHASQQDLARLIGMTRSTLQRSLGELVEAGAIETRYRS